MKKSAFVFAIVILAVILGLKPKTSGIIELSEDGTWCWFSDPRAIYIPENGGLLVTGFVTENGSVAAEQFNIGTEEKSISILNEKLETDDHNNPAFVQRADGRLLAFYTKHHNANLYMNVSINPNDATAWGVAKIINPNGKVDLEKYGDDKYTYANPFKLASENNRIYLFGRWIGFKPNMSWSDDGGETWVDGRVVVCPEPFSWKQRPYVKYYSDGNNKIHMVFTDGHPRDESTNSVYYACYYQGAFHRANGEVICKLNELPFEPKEATLVYDAKQTGARAWVYDVSANAQDQPSIAYAQYPTEQEHIYHYAWFDGMSWNDIEMVNSGKWFPHTPEGKTEREPHYSGGLTIDSNNEHTLFVSREVRGVFEIEKWSLVNGQWQTQAITSDSKTDQIRPCVVKNCSEKTLVLWNSIERYIHYTDFKTGVLLYQE